MLEHHMSTDSTELPSSSDPSIEADNRKATQCHIGRDESMQGTSCAYFSTHFWTNYIDRVSPRAHDSRIGRARALTTWAMADLHILCETCMDLS